MKRRNFLVGVGGTAIGGSVLVGSGAFSRVESNRSVTIEVAKDPDAYLGLDEGDSENADNYVDFDGDGHIRMNIGDQGGEGEGVNSNSLTFFDDMFRVTNQGKENATVCLDYDNVEFGDAVEDGTDANVEDVLTFYTGEAQGSQGMDGINEVPLCEEGDAFFELGTEHTVGVLVDTTELKGDIDDDELTGTLIDGHIGIIADVDGAGA